MFKRQSLQAVGSARPICAPIVRVSGVRYMSDAPPADGQRAPGKPSNKKPAKSPSEKTSTPHNTPNTGRTRQQRAARVSEEVRMLNRDGPASRSIWNKTPNPAGRSRGVDSEAIFGRSPKGQMGKNISADREGPNAQGAGRVIRAGHGGNQVRSERSPKGAVEDPSQGGARALAREVAAQQEEMEEDDGEEEEAPSTQHELILLEQFDKQDITAVPFEPEAVTKDEYLKLGQGGATIAAGNYEGVLEDRLRLLAEPTQDGFRWAPDMAARMLKGGFVSFQSEEEKAAVVAAAEKIHGSVKRTDRAFAPVAKSSKDALVDKLVRGAYPDPKAASHKQPILNDIVRNTLRNSTYLASDQSKLLKKITSLLPSENAAARRPAPKAARK